MEYLAKGTLNTYKKESDKYNNIINPRRAYNWTIQLADVMFIFIVKILFISAFLHKKDKTTVKICLVCANTNPSNDATTSDWLNIFGLPFDEQDIKFSKFGEYINNDENRPPLKKDMNPVLRDIIAKFWKSSPEERPTMDQVLKSLKERVHELAIADIPVVRMETIVYSSRLALSYGSMTFKGNIPEHKESIAIKVLGSRGRVQHIRREVDNLWKIDRPNIQHFIVLIKDVDEIYGMVFEYMQMGSVGDYIFGEKDGYEDVCTPSFTGYLKELNANKFYLH